MWKVVMISVLSENNLRTEQHTLSWILSPKTVTFCTDEQQRVNTAVAPKVRST